MTETALRPVDINADAGEGFDDSLLAPHVTSLNIACGGHAGDRETMRRALDLAAANGLRAGAHPGYPDRAGFGRVPMSMPVEALASAVGEQLTTLAAVAAGAGVRLTHVKPHGALYNELWDDVELVRVVARAAASVLPGARLVLPAASPALAASAGTRALAEVFLDRGYGPDGRLLPRSAPGAVVTDPGQLEAQLRRLASLEFETMGVHGDNPAAPALLDGIEARLARHGMRAAPYEVA